MKEGFYLMDHKASEFHPSRMILLVQLLSIPSHDQIAIFDHSLPDDIFCMMALELWTVDPMGTLESGQCSPQRLQTSLDTPYNHELHCQYFSVQRENEETRMSESALILTFLIIRSNVTLTTEEH